MIFFSHLLERDIQEDECSLGIGEKERELNLAESAAICGDHNELVWSALKLILLSRTKKSIINDKIEAIEKVNPKCQMCYALIPNDLKFMDYPPYQYDLEYFNLKNTAYVDTSGNGSSALGIFTVSSKTKCGMVWPEVSPQIDNYIMKMISEMGYESKENLAKLKEEIHGLCKPFEFIGNSLELSKLYNNLKVLFTEVDKKQKAIHVLITGEEGVGKNMLAEIISEYYVKVIKNDTRAKPEKVEINCKKTSYISIESRFLGTTNRCGLLHGGAVSIILSHIEEFGDSEFLSSFMRTGEYYNFSEDAMKNSRCGIIFIARNKDSIPANLSTHCMTLEIPNLNSRRVDITELAHSFCNDIVKRKKPFEKVWEHIEQGGLLDKWKKADWSNTDIKNITGLKAAVEVAVELFQNPPKSSKTGANPYPIPKHTFLLSLFEAVSKETKFETKHFLRFYIRRDWRFECEKSNTMQGGMDSGSRDKVVKKAREQFDEGLQPALSLIMDPVKKQRKLYRKGKVIIKKMYKKLNSKAVSITHGESGKYFEHYTALEENIKKSSLSKDELIYLEDIRKEAEEALENLIQEVDKKSLIKG